jgi:hypothetical protein
VQKVKVNIVLFIGEEVSTVDRETQEPRSHAAFITTHPDPMSSGRTTIPASGLTSTKETTTSKVLSKR